MGKNPVFINLSNHPSDRWSAAQQEEALCHHAAIIDMPFPDIDSRGTDSYINGLVEKYLEKVISYGTPTVMLQGEFIFTFRLITKLKERGITVVAARSERIAREVMDEKGHIVIKKKFDFVGFMEY